MKLPGSQELGFSLVELLLAASCGVIVLLAVLQLLVDYTKQDRVLVENTLAKEELMRGVSFIQMETRMSYAISSSATAFPTGSGVSDCLGSTYIPFLGLQVRQLSSTNQSVDYAVIYALRNLNTSADTPWQGPYAIYRCGPAFKQDGSYGNYSSSPVIVTDRIADAPNATDPSCGSSTVRMPSTPNVGLKICVDSGGRAMQIYLTGMATDGSRLPTMTAYAAARSL